MMVNEAVTQLLQRRDAVYNDLSALEPHRGRFFCSFRVHAPWICQNNFYLDLLLLQLFVVAGVLC